MTRSTSLLRAAVAGAFLLATGAAGCSSGPTASAPTTLGSTDAAFVIGATQSSDAEISAAKLAMTKSSNPDVLAFASEMITDHDKENADLTAATQNDSPGPPVGTVNAMQAAEAQTLMSLTGTAFDNEYVNSEITGHTLNLDNNYQPEVASGTNTSVQNYAKQYVSQIQMHLTMVQSIATKDGL